MKARRVYLILCMLGFVIPYSQFVPWLLGHGLNIGLFFRELFANRTSAFFAMDVIVSAIVLIYTLLSTGQVYQERGAAALDEHQKDRIVHRLERRIARLGYQVHLEPVVAAAP